MPQVRLTAGVDLAHQDQRGPGIAGGEEGLHEIVIAGDPHPVLVPGRAENDLVLSGQLGEVKQVRSGRQALQLSNIFFNLVI